MRMHHHVKQTNPRKQKNSLHDTHTKETGQYGFTNIRNMVKRGAVEICITLGGQTGSLFSLFPRFPPHWHPMTIVVYKTTCEIPGES
jgi:hypothetical protein